MSSKIVILFLLIVTAAAAFGVNQTPTPGQTNTPSEKITVIAKNLQVPWALAFLPSEEILVTERVGYVKIIKKDGSISPSIIAQISDLVVSGEGGLLGIAIDPRWQSYAYVYLYYTYKNDGKNTLNKVVRYTFNGMTLEEKTIIVDAIPGASNHNGGRIKFGPDGYLYITTGDAQNPSLAQDKNSLAGKILRVTKGKVEVYSYGHRNPQGIAWDNKGNLWETEHGSSACDELNNVEKGKNFGWPNVRCDQKQNDMVSPMIQSGNDTWAPAGLAYYNGSLFFAGLRGQALYEVIINGLTLKEHFKGEFCRIRDVILGPDNMLYITTSNRDGRGSPTSDDDKIIRVDPQAL